MKRYYDLDLIRFFAAVAVILFHYTFRGYAADGLSPVHYQYLGEIFKYGKFGVELFFMISGYVILMSAAGKTAVDFTIGRIARLYPAFWFCVGFTSICIVIADLPIFQLGVKQVVVNLTMIPSFFGVRFVDGVYWTLFVELKFYFIIFSIILFGLMRWIVPILILWLALAQLSFHAGVPGWLEFFLIDKYACYFVAGCFFYLAKDNGFTIPVLFGLVLAFMASIFSVLDLEGFREHYNTSMSPVICLAILTGFYCLFSLVALGKTAAISRPWMLYGGVVTYPLYLLHQNIGFILFNIFGASINKYALLFIVVVLMILLSYAVHILIEKRFGRQLSRFLVVVCSAFSEKIYPRKTRG